MPQGPLKGIRHLVVLMLENRSFDHMLGYLSLPPGQGGLGRTDVDGLKGGETNVLAGQSFGVLRLANTAFAHDPHHDAASVREQIETAGPAGGLMGGFVESFDTVPGVTSPGDLMGYYTGVELPMYDFLARHYCVCDRWFCSMPGPTIPNRLFALAGTSRRVANDILRPFTLPSVFQILSEQDVSWEIYFEGIVSSLHLFSGRGRMDDAHFHGHDFLLKRPADRPLPAVSWIDPAFLSHADDDHPPADVAQGQILVRRVFDALSRRAEWPQTLFIVTYDEHGGFYDHVPPPGFGGTPPIPDDSPDPGMAGGYNPFRHLGPRVPTLLVSPAIRQPVCSDVLDHTSIVRTIVEQFCPDPAAALNELPLRVRQWSKAIPPALFAPAPAASPLLLSDAAPRPRRPTAEGLRSVREAVTGLERRLKRPGKAATIKKRRATALERETRSFLERLSRRGVAKRRHLPGAWR